jgi:hypothetical protein
MEVSVEFPGVRFASANKGPSFIPFVEFVVRIRDVLAYAHRLHHSLLRLVVGELNVVQIRLAICALICQSRLETASS